MTRERFIDLCVQHGATPRMAEYAVERNLALVNLFQEPEQEATLLRILPRVMQKVQAALAPWN